MDVLTTLLARAKVAENGCLEWQGATDGKYGLVQLHKLVRTHRTMWEYHNGPIPPGMLICHKCDNPICMEITHLFMGTAQDNTDDMMRKGRHGCGRGERPSVTGSKHPRAKLNEEQIIAIRNDTRFAWQIAKDYNVSRSTISHVKNNYHWTHVQKEG